MASFCHDRNPYPRMVVRGKFRSSPFFLSILLEPVKGTEVVEVVDTLSNELRAKEKPA